MRGRITLIVLLDLLFLLLLTASAVIDGVGGRVIYYLAYILPVGIGLLYAKKTGTKSTMRLLPSEPLSSLALFAPTLIAVIGISAATAAILTALGKTNVTDVSGNLFAELLRHALVPAVLEELLFRYVPTRLLGDRSPRVALAVSAVMFALIHLNLFQIPYALFAGGVLAFITLSSGSIIPAMLLHFINNTVSVICMREPEMLSMPICLALLLLCVPSVIYIVFKKSKYREMIGRAFSGERLGFSPELCVAVLLCVIAAILNLR